MKYKFLRRFFEMAERSGIPLNEVFALVPDSYQQYASEVRTALRDDPPEEIGRDDWAYVEALIGDEPKEALIECYHSDGKCSYYLYDLSFEDGKIKWSNQREVEVEAALKVKSVVERRMNETVDPPQEVVVDVSDFDIAFEEDDKKFASVAIAQKAEVRNRNNRIYPADVLEDAVERLKTHIKLNGPVAMETMHREQRNIGDVCAVIHEVAFNRETGVVTLPKIELLETTSGQNVQVLLDVVPAFQVSQRGVGISHEEIDPNTGLRVQIMDWLRIDGWDLVWNGEASVEEAVLTLNEDVSGSGNGGESANEDQIQQQQGQQGQDQLQSGSPPPPPSGQQRQVRSTGGYFRTGAGNGSPLRSVGEGQGQQQGQEQQGQGQQGSPPAPPAQQQRQGDQQQQGVIGKEVLGLVQTAVEQALGPLRMKLENEHGELRRKEFSRVAEEVLDAVLAKHPRFSEKQKGIIKSGIDLNTAYSQVESLDADSITRVLTPVIEKKIEEADELVATDLTRGWNLPAQAQGNGRYINRAGGVTYTEVISDAHASGIFEAADFNAIVEGAIDEMVRNDRDNNWVMPLDHPGMKPLADVLDSYFLTYGAALVQETAAAGVGIPVNQVSMLLVPTVWRMTTAFQIAQLHPMSLTVEDIPIERYKGQGRAGSSNPANDWERWNALDPGDNVAIPESVLDYEHYRLAVGYQPQHVKVTPRARALTKNTVMNPTMRSTALAARDIVDHNDSMLWRSLIMEALKFEHVKVSTWTALTRVGTTDEYTVRKGVIPYEWIVTEDPNENVAKSGLVRNFPADGSVAATSISQRKLEPFALRDAGSGNTELQYGTHYTLDWVKGTITLTSAGRAIAAAADGVEAKYSYATNFVNWDATVPAGSTFVDHLYDLRFKLANARTKVKNRHYEPECICMNYELMDKISGGGQFTNDGGNIANVIDAMSRITRFAGSESIDTTAIPKEYMIVSQKMSILFGMHTPFTLSGEVMTDETGNRRYFGEQWAGSGVPAPEKVSIVQVDNLP